MVDADVLMARVERMLVRCRELDAEISEMLESVNRSLIELDEVIESHCG